MRRRTDKRTPTIAERRLFGPHTCRVGGCGLDGTVGVDVPCVQWPSRPHPECGRIYSEVESTVRIYYCERHAEEAVAK